MQKHKELHSFLLFPNFINEGQLALAFFLDYLADNSIIHKENISIDIEKLPKLLKMTLDSQWLLSMQMMPSTDIKYRNAYQQIMALPAMIIILESEQKLSENHLRKISNTFNQRFSDNRPTLLGLTSEATNKLLSSI